jgi:DNA-binding IclR family transcriptional regulator
MAHASDTNPAQKVCRVLRVLSTPSPMRLADIAEATALTKATVLRLLETLAAEGFARRDADGRRWTLGDEAAVLGLAMQRRDHVRDRARPWMVRLASLSGDTVLLSTPSGVESVCVDREFGDYPIRANYLDVGSRRPLGVGGGSLALLAWLPDDEVRAVLDQVEPVLAARYPRISRTFLEDAVQRARRLGHVLLLDVVVERMGGLAVPVFGVDGRPVAAISIAALSDRLASRLELLLPAMRQAADALSAPGAAPALARGPARTVRRDEETTGR